MFSGVIGRRVTISTPLSFSLFLSFYVLSVFSIFGSFFSNHLDLVNRQTDCVYVCMYKVSYLFLSFFLSHLLLLLISQSTIHNVRWLPGSIRSSSSSSSSTTTSKWNEMMKPMNDGWDWWSQINIHRKKNIQRQRQMTSVCWLFKLIKLVTVVCVVYVFVCDRLDFNFYNELNEKGS